MANSPQRVNDTWHILRDAPSGAPQDEVFLEINDLPYPEERRLARLEGPVERFTSSQDEVSLDIKDLACVGERPFETHHTSFRGGP